MNHPARQPVEPVTPPPAAEVSKLPEPPSAMIFVVDAYAGSCPDTLAGGGGGRDTLHAAAGSEVI